jgi:deoxyribodipyrimidine photolyase
VARVLQSAGACLQSVWGFTLYHIDDLPVSPWKAHTYRSYTAFRQRVQDDSSVRPEAKSPRTWQPPPRAASLGWKDATLPTVAELCGADGPPLDDRAPVAWVGGESAALAWLHDYIWVREALALEYVGATNTMTKGKTPIGRDRTSKLSPWLAHGARYCHVLVRFLIAPADPCTTVSAAAARCAVGAARVPRGREVRAAAARQQGDGMAQA